MTSALKRIIKIVCLLCVFLQQRSPALFKIFSVYFDVWQNVVLP